MIMAILAQQIFARSLEAEEFPVERPVMRVAEHRAHSVHWNEIDIIKIAVHIHVSLKRDPRTRVENEKLL